MVCTRGELEPLRLKLAHGRSVLPELQARCAATYVESEERGRTSRECLAVGAECVRLEKALEDAAGKVCAWRFEAATARRVVGDRRRGLDRFEAALVARRAQVDALQRCVSLGAEALSLGETQTAWRRTVEIFALFPIKPASGQPRSRSSLRGVMTIVGLPLPNVGSGSVLVDALPPNVCASALAAVALLTAVVANVLGLALPHPVIPRLGTDGHASVCGDGVMTRSQQGGPRRRRHSFDSSGSSSSSSASGTRPTSWGRGSSFNEAATPPLHPRKSQRYALSPGDGDNFVIALNLLQNDVTHLCVKAGVDPGVLWPAEALLLNLAELRDTAERRVLEADGDDADGQGSLTPASDDDADDDLLVTPTINEVDPEEEEEDPSDDDDGDLRRLRDGRRPIVDHDDSASSAADENDDWIFLGSLPFLGLSGAAEE